VNPDILGFKVQQEQQLHHADSFTIEPAAYVTETPTLQCALFHAFVLPAANLPVVKEIQRSSSGFPPASSSPQVRGRSRTSAPLVRFINSLSCLNLDLQKGNGL
jgi:hypothetical protein